MRPPHCVHGWQYRYAAQHTYRKTVMILILRRVALLVAAVLVTFGGWAATARPASAHNVLRSTSPADGTIVDTVPSQIVLTFDEPAIAMGTKFSVTGPDGPAAAGPARLVDNTVHQGIVAGAVAGEYTVQWRVTSADGHPIDGAFSFTARAAGGGTESSSPASSAATATPAASDAGTTPVPPAENRGVPTWIWLVIAAVLVLSALTSAAAARRRNRR